MTAQDSPYDEREEYLARFAEILGSLDAASVIRATPTSFRELWTSSGLSSDAFASRMAQFLELPLVSLETISGSESLADRFSSRFLREFGAFPFVDARGRVTVAVSEPPDAAFHQAAQIVLETQPDYVIASYEDIASALSMREHEHEQASDARQTGGGSDDDIESLRDLASGAPVVRAISELCEKAVELRATDLHIEPMRDGLSIRMRVDGILRVIPAPPAHMAAALISRLKILGGLNIAERRIPQDGSARLRIAGNQVDVRIAILPTAHGEAAVIRFLPVDRGLLDLSRLGMSEASERTLRRLLQLRNGMIIICGPTGSGKTTTLAGALTLLNDKSRKILTIEDPIEYELAGVTQSQVNPAVGLTFATALRAFLRFDPNVIMVGEIRDGETAQIAVQAALTGHLLLTTLHTETASAAVPRLIDLGVEDFLLQSTLRAVIGQRLLRNLCDCKRQFALRGEDLVREPNYEVLGFRPGDIVCEPVGCDRCGNTGFRGRSGVFEILEVTPELRKLIRRGVDSPSIDALARERGFQTMMEDAIMQCRAGRTSISEVLRVTSVR